MKPSYLKNILDGNNENHILPFLWLREQTEETLRTEIEKIYECGIRAVCLESRPHPDFIGDGWWHDFDIVIDEAKKRGMKIWILDDAHFPTGMANGLIPAKYPELARKYVMTQFTDCAGPVAYANLDVNLMMTKEFKWTDFGKHIEKPLIDKQELISVTAFPLIHGDVISSQGIDITSYVNEKGWLTWNIPEGVWRICVSFTTYDFGSNNEYINYIDKKSVHTLIEAVYEPHFEHYKEEFGKTIAGFFSDEPGFYNIGGYQMHTAIGRTPGMALPWSEELQEAYEKSSANWKTMLPYLWLDSDDETIPAEQRRFYMDQVTRLYAEDFSCQLGQWCKDHGVEYIGHVVEDYEEHQRVGVGAGHYFRAMEGQAWAGIDDIGGAIIPGNDIGTRHGVTDDDDPEFYSYMLAVMGMSAAAIDPAKKGKLMCEMYGAYGWNFGVKNMKWLTDFLMFQGVNEIVPHAFSMADYPDIDCPPHFYARGNNGQYPYFAELMKYTNRICDLLSGAKNVPQAAVMYAAESDWMNESMKIQQIGKELLQNQITYQILPTDIFADRARYNVKFEQGCLLVNERRMSAIVVAETRFMDQKEMAVLKEAAAAGIPVYIAGKKPEYVIGDGVRTMAADMDLMKAVALDELAAALKDAGLRDAEASAFTPNLLVTHYEKDGDIYCLFNTHLAKTIDIDVTLPVSGKLAAYDGMSNQLISVDNLVKDKQDGKTTLKLLLPPYASLVLLANVEGMEELPAAASVSEASGLNMDISDHWLVSAVRSINYPNFPEAAEEEALMPYSAKNPEFAGIIRYERSVDIPEGGAANAVFAPEFIYEVAEVFVNGRSAGKKITPPYRWNIGTLLAEGKNEIRVEVANTPTRDTLHAPSPFGPPRGIIEPSGMFGKIIIK